MFISHKELEISRFLETSLIDFYETEIFRYNSFVDINKKTKEEYANFMNEFKNQEVFYKIYFLNIFENKIPILETMRIEDEVGGMLSSYLHDLDRDHINSNKIQNVSGISLKIWNLLLENEMTFLFPKSKDENSSTNKYMEKVGFKRIDSNYRIFFNGNNPKYKKLEKISDIFSILLSKKNYKSISPFNFEVFEKSKVIQKNYIDKWILLHAKNDG